MTLVGLLQVEIEWNEANREYCRREIFEMELEDMEEAPIVANKKEDTVSCHLTFQAS